MLMGAVEMPFPTMFKSILVAVDGSDHARKAGTIAADIAALYDAKLTLLHVVTGKKVADEVKRMAEVEHLVQSPLPGAPAYSTSVPAEISAPSPIVTPGRTLAPAPINAYFPIFTEAVG